MPFSFRRLSKTQFLALCVVLVGTITALGLSSRHWLTNTKEMKPVALAAPQAKIKANPLGKGYIDRRGVWPQLYSALMRMEIGWKNPAKNV